MKNKIYWNDRQMRVEFILLKVKLIENKKGEIAFTFFAPNLP
jgi:hypothetical protein